MKTKNHILSVICVAIASAASASAATTFQILQGNEADPSRTSIIYLNYGAGDIAVGTVTVTSNVLTSPDWKIPAQDQTNVPSSTLSIYYLNQTDASAQQLQINYSISLNAGISFAPGSSITIGSGQVLPNGPSGAQIGGQNNVALMSVNQNGIFTESLVSNFDINSGAYTAGTVFRNPAVLSNTTTPFSVWSVAFPQTTSASFSHTPDYIGTGIQTETLAERVSIGFEVVPEPSSALLSGLGALALLARRRRA